MSWFEITTLEITLPRLSPAFDGFKLVQISDIHFGTFIKQDRLEEVITAVNKLMPDLIVFTGDLVSDQPERHGPILVDCLKLLRSRFGLVAVRGNHDHWADAEQVGLILEMAGAAHLENDIFTVSQNGSQLHIAGLDCHYVGKDRLDRVLELLPSAGSAILLVHEPDYADISAKTERFDLQVSGHSHGGQISMPWYGPIWLPRFARKYPAGLYSQNGMIHYTNRGIGTSHLKIRFNCPPEIALFRLYSARDQDSITLKDLPASRA